jgi:hypothetical protein
MDRIGRITTGGSVSFFPLPTPGARAAFLAAGPDGALWFSEVAQRKIGRIGTDGSITEFPVDGYPFDIAAGPDGALWFAIQAAVGRITPAGAVTTFSAPADPGAITAGPDNALWFTEFDANKIGRITTSGEITELAIPTANSGVSDITTGPDGNVWFAEADARKLGRVLLAPPTVPPPVPTVIPQARAQRDLTAPALTMRAVKQSLRDVARKGLAVRVACDERCTMVVTVAVPRPVARRLRVPAKLATARFTIAGPTTVRVKLSKRANRALRTQRRIAFRVRATPTDVVGNTGRARSISVRVRR